mmetsp:Transcript_22827/g.28002  ORF Transcript_22827/g.28002 Transcript_22827/m.28002 type:complete len:635 (+) Transcript_22827:221-2125(+)
MKSFRNPSLASIIEYALILLTLVSMPSFDAFAPARPSTLSLQWHQGTNINKNFASNSRLTKTHDQLHMSSSWPSTEGTNGATKIDVKDGIYDLKGKDDHIAFLENNPDSIMIIKFYAPWCRACKGLEPKFKQISKDPKYANLPLKFAQLSVQHNKDYIKSLGILALPSVHIIVGKEEGLVENFPCGPSKVPILKKKIAQVVNARVDPKTFKLKPFQPETEEKEDEACAERSISATTSAANEKTQVSVGDVVVSEETMKYIRSGIPFFTDLTEEEFKTLMSKSVYKTFEAGSVIMKQGMRGRTFYIIDKGEVEILVKGAFEDPLTTPSGYLGAVVNRLCKNNYFGERSLITGQPRAASIRTIEKTRCFTFDIDDIPESSALSGKMRATEERLNQIDEKYALDYYDIKLIDKQFVDANKANQIKGSPNGPDRTPEIEEKVTDDKHTGQKDAILSLLIRFKLLRHAARCFEYILQTNPIWGDSGETYRRSLLVSKLSQSQRSEFKDVFTMIDTSNDGVISVSELKNALESIYDEQQSDEKVKEIINKADPSVDGNLEIKLDEFMGVMAEAEFYFLFKETFATLDKDNSGYVQAYKLDKVLCGLRDLISDDRKSIIDIEDKDMLVDYETFSRMMIGTL